MKRILCSLLLTWISCTAIAQSVVSDPKAVTFKIRNFGLWVEGSFNGLNGEIRFDPLNPANALFEVTLDANSIETGLDLRNKHLRKEEYLDVKRYPQIRFTSSSVVKGNKHNGWIVTGQLTIKKVTKEITFPFLFETKDDHSLFSGEFMINRRDFGVGGKSFSMADELSVILKVSN